MAPYNGIIFFCLVGLASSKIIFGHNCDNSSLEQESVQCLKYNQSPKYHPCYVPKLSSNASGCLIDLDNNAQEYFVTYPCMIQFTCVAIEKPAISTIPFKKNSAEIKIQVPIITTNAPKNETTISEKNGNTEMTEENKKKPAEAFTELPKLHLNESTVLPELENSTVFLINESTELLGKMGNTLTENDTLLEEVTKPFETYTVKMDSNEFTESDFLEGIEETTEVPIALDETTENSEPLPTLPIVKDIDQENITEALPTLIPNKETTEIPIDGDETEPTMPIVKEFDQDHDLDKNSTLRTKLPSNSQEKSPKRHQIILVIWVTIVAICILFLFMILMVYLRYIRKKRANNAIEMKPLTRQKNSA